MKVQLIILFLSLFLSHFTIYGQDEDTKNEKVKCINSCTLDKEMINGNNTICMNPVYKQPTCFADKTMGCYTGTALLMLSSNVIESRKIQGCFTRRNRRSTLHDTSTFQGDKGPIRPYKRIKNTNFISNVTFCYNEVCNV